MKPSPAAMPSEPPKNEKSCTVITAGVPFTAPKAMAMAATSPVAERAAARRSG